MKKVIILVMLLVPFLMMAQKPVKPSLQKAEKALREGKFDEAKTIIDATTTSDEFMKDKKGQPSKSAAKAWYLKGLVYASLDTTSNQQFKSLASNPLATAKESFEKCYELDKGKDFYINDAMGIVPLLDDQVHRQLAQVYLNRAITAYKDEKNYKKAFADMETVVYFLPKDTTQLMNAGVYFGPAAEEYDKSLDYMTRYFAAGGKQIDAYTQYISIYYDKKKDKENTLKAVAMGLAKYPDNPDFPKYELNIYLADKKYDLARKFVQDGIRKHPDDKESYYLLGGLYVELQNYDSAKIAYQMAVDLDNGYFDAASDLAKLYYQDAKKIKSERDKLGISAKEIAKRKVLFDELQKKYQIALPYWEKCLKIKGDDEVVLYTLYEIYGSLVMDDKAEIMRKKMKALGYLD